eukprot:292190-Heterocapsa_arctica.AAC.1
MVLCRYGKIGRRAQWSSNRRSTSTGDVGKRTTHPARYLRNKIRNHGSLTPELEAKPQETEKLYEAICLTTQTLSGEVCNISKEHNIKFKSKTRVVEAAVYRDAQSINNWAKDVICPVLV